VILLHAGLLSDGLLLWGERAANGKGRPGAARAARRGPRSGRPGAHPRDAGPEGVAGVLQGVGLGGMRPRAEGRVAWLPTASGEPLASSPLLGGPPGGPVAVLAPWTVTTHPLGVPEAAELLAACVGRTALAPGVFVGVDLGFAVDVLRFAAALVAREQFLPGIEESDGVWRAVWTAVLAAEDGPRIAALARSMPAACRAVGGSPDAPPEVETEPLVRALVGAFVDHLVRTPRRTDVRGPRRNSLHDEWVRALFSQDGVLRGSSAELAVLAAQVHTWQRPAAATTAAPFRLTFRLEEPSLEGGAAVAAARNGSWYVRYLLQSARDPSLLVPADEVFSPRGARTALLREPGFDAREHLLASLGQAAGIEPRIETSLRDRAPAGYSLDTEGAYEFLSARAVGLEQAGFGILLPGWWSRRGTRARLTLRAAVPAQRATAGGGLSLDEVVQFQWRVAVGGETLTLAELKELARMKAPLVRVRGRWVQMSAGEIEAALRFWEDNGKASATLREMVALALGARKPPGHLAFDGVEAGGGLGDLLATLEGHASVEELAPPAGFHGILRPYQLRGYSWMDFLGRLGFGACLADDMGLGKTVQALALVQRHWSAGRREPALLVCPMSVVGNWQKEAARFTPELPVLVHHGLSRAKGASFSRDASRHALVVSSYSLLHRDLEAFQAVRWSGVILDEAQNVKNAETQQARAARALAGGYRVALTGTPVENNVADLWSIMEFLNPGLLGTQADFKRSFLVPIQAGRDAEAVSRLKRLTAPFVLRRLKTDRSIIADLPEKMEMKVFCNLTREQASLYAAVLQEATRELEAAEGIRRKGLVLATLARLKQVCNHPAHLLADNSPLPGRSGKLARLTEMLEEVLEEGDRALVFTQFAEMGGLLKRHLQESFGRETLFLHGGTRKADRDRMVERFQGEADGPRLFVLSLKAGGVGLNLTAASHVFHFDRWWNPAVEAQATDRAFRIGQTRRVQVRKLLCTGTLEERIDEMIESKKGLAETVIGTGEGWLTELSTRELREVLALRPEAVGE